MVYKEVGVSGQKADSHKTASDTTSDKASAGIAATDSQEEPQWRCEDRQGTFI